MDNLSTTSDDKLLDFLDGNLTQSEIETFKSDLANSSPLQRRLEELRIIHESLQSQKLESPSANFTERVLRNISQLPVASFNPWRGVFILLGIAIATGLGLYVLSSGSADSLSVPINLQSFEIPGGIKNTLPSFSINMRTLTNTILFANTAIAFLILDRIILRPLFRSRNALNY
ncbi:MAG: hypothetical protein HC811_03915 [Flammeovirgaceae bacterium]|nr:hypothetical protein [Flammeovirgaceae bacterium]